MRGSGRSQWFAALAYLVVCGELHAEPAASSELSLRWLAPENCPQREAVLSQIRDLAADAYPGDPNLQVEGTVSQLDNRRYVLELKLADHDGVEVRRIEASACRELAGGAAVIVGLKLTAGGSAPKADSASNTGTEVESGAEGPKTVPAASPANPEPQPRPKADRERDTARSPRLNSGQEVQSERDVPSGHDWWLALPEVGASVGALPTPLFTLQATFGRRLGAWSIAASGRYAIARSVGAVDVPGVGARVQLHSAALSVGRGWRSGAFSLEPGLAVRAHYLTARGEGDDLVPASASAVVLQWGMDLNLRWVLNETLALRATLSGGVHAGRPRLIVDALGEVQRLGPGQLAFSLGPELSF